MPGDIYIFQVIFKGYCVGNILAEYKENLSTIVEIITIYVVFLSISIMKHGFTSRAISEKIAWWSMEKIVYSCSWKDGLSWQEVLQKSIYSDLIETSLLKYEHHHLLP